MINFIVPSTESKALQLNRTYLMINSTHDYVTTG